MPTPPTITTVLPTYRRAPLLARAVRSVLNQSFKDFEVHIYDNASGDDTARVARELTASDARVKYHCHPVNLGAIANFHYGVERVASPYFNILSDDDYLLPHFFEGAVAALGARPEAGLFAGKLAHVDADGGFIAAPLEGWRAGFYPAPDAALRWLKRGDTWTSMLFRRDHVRLTGGIDVAVGLEADFDLLLRLLVKFPIVVSAETCARFTIHRGSAMSQNSIAGIVAGMERIEAKLRARTDLEPQFAGVLARALSAADARRLFRLGLKLARAGARDELEPARIALEERYGRAGLARCLEWASAPDVRGALMRKGFGAAYELRRAMRRQRCLASGVIDDPRNEVASTLEPQVRVKKIAALGLRSAGERES